MRKLSHVSNLFTTEPALALAAACSREGPWRFSSVFFGNSGTEANEAALKYARLYSAAHERPRAREAPVLHRRVPWPHPGPLSCTPSPKYQDPYLPLLPGVVVRPTTTRRRSRTLTDEFAGVIVEVIQGEGGLAAMTRSSRGR